MVRLDQLLLGIPPDLPLVWVQVLGGVEQGLMGRVVEASRAQEQLRDHLVGPGRPLDVVCVVGFVGSELSEG